MNLRRLGMALLVAAGLWLASAVVFGVGSALAMPGASDAELNAAASTAKTAGLAVAGFGGAWYYTR